MTGPPPKLLVTVTVVGLLFSVTIKVQVPGWTSVIAVKGSGFCPAAVKLSTIAGSLLDVVAMTVKVVVPF